MDVDNGDRIEACSFGVSESKDKKTRERYVALVKMRVEAVIFVMRQDDCVD